MFVFTLSFSMQLNSHDDIPLLTLLNITTHNSCEVAITLGNIGITQKWLISTIKSKVFPYYGCNSCSCEGKNKRIEMLRCQDVSLSHVVTSKYHLFEC